MPFDPERVRLTGLWSADDGGIYYIRQIGDQVWWNGMSDMAQAQGELGRDWNNVAQGALKGTVITATFADVPRGNIWGNGNLILKVQADAAGDLLIQRVGGDFGGTWFTPCRPAVQTAPGFIRPFSYSVPFGMGYARWQVAPYQAVLTPADSPGSGITVWAVGAGWAPTCSVAPDTAPPATGADGLLAYLRSLPGLTVGDETTATIDGRPAIAVDVTYDQTGPVTCLDGQFHLWKETDLEASVPASWTTRLVALDVDGATVVFEIWGLVQSSWVPQAEAILATVRFDTVAMPTQTLGKPADDGARVVRVDQLDARTVDLTIESPAVGFAKVRLLLPAGYGNDAAARWPVLYLLQGCCDDYSSWTRETDVEELTAGTDLLVVMPDAGGNGWYSDWWNAGAGGRPMWEAFHLQELPQLLERNWGAGDQRVIAGLSMGGLGAMSYAARHPGMFKAAASFSGVLDTLGSDFENDEFLWGDKTDDVAVWKEHDPLSLAPALEGIPLYVSYGDGQPGPLDPSYAEPDGSEAWIWPQNEAFVARLKELGIPATVDAYGAGTHTWPYWERALGKALPMLLEALGEPGG